MADLLEPPNSDERHCIVRSEPIHESDPWLDMDKEENTDQKPQLDTVWLQSSRAPKPQSAAMAPLIKAKLAQLGITQRLVMPTKANQDRLETLIETICKLIALQKSYERLVSGLIVLRFLTRMLKESP